MARLIDADKLKNTLIGLMNTSSPVPSDNDCAIDGLLNLLDDQPDVDPVKHGRWLHKHNGYAKCSVCGAYFAGVYDDDNEDKYCRRCGAKMDSQV
ncbi:MAG: hypothetical protein ACI3WS_03720 [Phascolarctobacterium sp.]